MEHRNEKTGIYEEPTVWSAGVSDIWPNMFHRMPTDVYSYILDDDRRKNAELFEEAFYEKKNLDPQMHVQQENNNATVADEVDPELLAKVLANPEMRALLNSLAKTMK